ncbi:Glycosyltransferase involved in cell wall bisynthesis [Roseomonas rosea]|uniref:Glycosyltransferase involved in cell wall bisynthesis n=1 Tax=Muricoccus roseus TaxID=198092 RepID=A0A1M6I276_9PROT|nr:glycosyltransferase family 2 protein [Roseomonas rosea]SHJ28548.1 Glycosyltransferase involved in cell wall bisynthesis [Roseomonas rosea]
MSRTHLVVIPSYNTGPQLAATVAAARAAWPVVWVVVDGSTDGSAAPLRAIEDPGFRLIERPRNGGKGAAIRDALEAAERDGFTHALTMDADGQHPAGRIPDFMAASVAHPGAMILGSPVFGPEAPLLRVRGRRISNWWAGLETLWCTRGGEPIRDSLYGFRVYPIVPLLRIMRRNPWMRRYDFDAEAVVRLAWRGVPALNMPAAVRYLTPAEGGVSHFRYGRDNLLLTGMHTRLMLGFLWRLPLLLGRALQLRKARP